MLWFLVWAVLVVLALVVIGRLVWSLFHKGVALVAEMGEASTRLSQVAEQVERLTEQRAAPQLAVFEDPRALRRERERRAKDRRRRRARSARRRMRSA